MKVYLREEWWVNEKEIDVLLQLFIVHIFICSVGIEGEQQRNVAHSKKAERSKVKPKEAAHIYRVIMTECSAIKKSNHLFKKKQAKSRSNSVDFETTDQALFKMMQSYQW